MMKNKNHTINISVFGTRIFDGCKTILQLSLRFNLIGVLIVSAGCNPSTNHYHSNPTAIQPSGSGADPTKQAVQTGGPGSGGGGTGDGGGGQGVYCSETVSDDKLKGKLLVRDIYEAVKNHQRTMQFSKLGNSGTVDVDDAAIDHLVGTLRNFFGPASSKIDLVTVSFWKTFAKNISFIDEGSRLYPSQDANSPLALPEGCKIVQIAYWDESSGPFENGTLYVDKKSWKQLDQFNKIALLAHEYFFKKARRAGYKNSDFVRYKVGQLLSQESLVPLFSNWVPAADSRVADILPENRDGFKFCTGKSLVDPEAKLQMYQYAGSDGKQHIIFPSFSSSTINFSEFLVPHVTFKPDEESSLNLFLDVMVPATHHPSSFMFSDYTSGYEKEDQRILDFRYLESGFLYKKDFAVNFKESLKWAWESLSEFHHRDKVWKLFGIRGNSYEILLHSSMSELSMAAKGVKKILPPEELIPKINKEIFSRIKDTNWTVPWEKDDKGLYTALGTLAKEVDDMISSGIFDPTFPRWNKELKVLKQNISGIDFRKEGHNFSESKIDTDEDLTKILPKLIYLVRSNRYDANNFLFLNKKMNPYVDDIRDHIRMISLGNISFRSENETVRFVLECQDYVDLFRERTSKEAYSVEHRELLNTDLKYAIDKESRNNTLTEDSVIYGEEFLKHLSSSIVKKKEDFIYCGTDKSQKVICAEIDSFLADLQRETLVEMKYCKGYLVHDIDNDRDVLVNCGIFELKEAKQKYRILFEYPNNGYMKKHLGVHTFYNSTTGPMNLENVQIRYAFRIP